MDDFDRALGLSAEEKEKAERLQQQMALEREKEYAFRRETEAKIFEQAEKKKGSGGKAAYEDTKNRLGEYADKLKEEAEKTDGILTAAENLDDNDPEALEEKTSYRNFKRDINACVEALKEYSAIRGGLDSQNVDASIKRETAALKKLEESIEAVDKSMMDAMQYKSSETKGFTELQNHIADIMGTYSKMVNGSLGIEYTAPELNAKKNVKAKYHNPEYEFGKTAHYINATGPQTPRADLSYGKIKKRLEGYNYTNFGELRQQEMGKPLFLHDPCAADVYQGCIGDCYLITSLAAIAEKSPEKIREMIRLSDDGKTATVRLYNHENEPVFVTVDNSEWVVDCKDEAGKDSVMEAFARGASWVKLVEKAYAASCLHLTSIERRKGTDEETNLDQKSLDAEKKGFRGAYDDVIGGYTPETLQTLIGEESKYFLDGKNPAIKVFGTKKPYKAPSENHPVIIKQGRDYFPDELAAYDAIKKAFDEEHLMTAGTKQEPNPNSYDLTMEQYYEKRQGLPMSHAYMVEDVYEKDGLKYVVVRDPHNQGGQAYRKDGTAYYDAKPERAGRSDVELSIFVRTFSKVEAINYNAKAENKKQIVNAEDVKKLYGDALSDVCKQMNTATNFAKNVGSIPTDFAELRKAAFELDKKLKSNDTRSDDLVNSMRKLFTAAETCRENSAANIGDIKKLGSTKAAFAANRMFLTEVIHNIGEAFEANQQTKNPKPVFTNDMQKKAFNIKPGDGASKEFAVGKIKERMDKDREKAAADKKKQVEKLDKSIASAEKALEKTIAKYGPADPKTAAAIALVMYYSDVKKDSKNLSAKVLKGKLDGKTVKENLKRTTRNINDSLNEMREDPVFNNINDVISRGNAKDVVEKINGYWDKKMQDMMNEPDEPAASNNAPQESKKTESKNQVVAGPH